MYQTRGRGDLRITDLLRNWIHGSHGFTVSVCLSVWLLVTFKDGMALALLFCDFLCYHIVFPSLFLCVNLSLCLHFTCALLTMEKSLNGSDITETPLREQLDILKFHTDTNNIELIIKRLFN